MALISRPGAIACFALGLATTIGLALSTASASVRPTPPDLATFKGKLATDGALTVNQPETVLANKLPPKVKLRLSIVPPPSASCTNPKTGFCITAPIPPASGTPAFRTDGKGRATLTFVTPDHYDLLNGINLMDRTPAPFTNGQQVVVSVSGLRPTRRDGHKELLLAVAQSRAVMQVLPPPPAS